ncbi:hypothetical protein [Formosa sp. S-31]|uniref:hypothetical protein n=1 Tax=Formosa sp. S-31 TaxID=2790949 RepID=UPI003EB6E783
MVAKHFTYKQRKKINTLVLILGNLMFWIYFTPVIARDLEFIKVAMLSLFFMLIYLVPNIVFTGIAERKNTKLQVIISGSFMLLTQLIYTHLFIKDMLKSTSSTAGLGILSVWIPPLIALFLGLGIAVSIEMFTKKQK